MKPAKKYDVWTRKDIDFLVQNVNKLPLNEIYNHFATRSKMSVDLKIKRLRLTPIKTVNPERVQRNFVIEMLEQRIGDPKNFQPQRAFFQRVKIGQKRFWQLYRGEKNLTEKEYKALSKEWNITLDDAFELHHLIVFDK